jgi:hypothetical protein
MAFLFALTNQLSAVNPNIRGPDSHRVFWRLMLTAEEVVVETTMEEVGKGHYLGMKCLFEMIGLYPGDRSGGRSCGRFRRPRRCYEGWVLATSQCRNQELPKIPRWPRPNPRMF